ncbi:MAG: hypothetical protein F9K34_04425 [Albidovulum sp.]|nr:MAG: hypothetical protein F9K34_04425 [Defluviimonas sp.]
MNGRVASARDGESPVFRHLVQIATGDEECPARSIGKVIRSEAFPRPDTDRDSGFDIMPLGFQIGNDDQCRAQSPTRAPEHDLPAIAAKAREARVGIRHRAKLVRGLCDPRHHGCDPLVGMFAGCDQIARQNRHDGRVFVGIR